MPPKALTFSRKSVLWNNLESSNLFFNSWIKLLMDENRSLYFFHQTLFSYIGEKLHDFWYLLLLGLI